MSLSYTVTRRIVLFVCRINPFSLPGPNGIRTLFTHPVRPGPVVYTFQWADSTQITRNSPLNRKFVFPTIVCLVFSYAFTLQVVNA